MTPRLNQLSFGQRLAAIVLFPLLAFIASLGYLLSSVIDENQHIETLKAVPEFSASASALIHNLQIERGLSAGYIGSKGRKFSAKLDSHVSNTDTTLTAFRNSIDHEKLQALHPGIERDLQQLLAQLDQLDATRASIRSQSWPVKRALAWYTNTNGQLLSLIETLFSESTLPEISRQGLATVNFMNIKERSGIIRAVLTGTFASNAFAAGMRDRFITLLAEQQVFKSKFDHFSDSKTRSAYAALTNQPVFTETARMIDTAKTRGSNFGIDAADWFEKQTRKINALKSFEDKLTQQISSVMEQQSSASEKQLWAEIILGALVLLATMLLSWTLIRRLSAESAALSGALEQISHGDLSETALDYEGPAFTALGRMRTKLVEVNSAISHVTHTVRSSAKEISAANTSLAQRAEEQATNLEKTAASMEQITATVKLTSENLQQGNQLSEDAKTIANDGQLIVGKAIEAMNEINEDSKKIADIINVIDEIAFQTNLLALNAAVEAARAGEQGRGFAVVAAEVRNLAQRSAEAAQEIKTLIEASVKKIHSGSDLVNASGDSLQGIVEAVTKVSNIIAEISTAGQEQAIGVEQINDSIMKLDDVNQQNAAMVEEVAVSSKILEEQSTELEQLISFYHYEAQTAADSRTAQQPDQEPKHDAEPQPATDPINERRSSNRPWSAASNRNTSTAVTTAEGTDDVWEAF